MSDFPTDLKYTSSHEWVQKNDDGTITMGISDHAQEALGDLVFVELPEVGESFDKEEQFAVVESVKAASDVYSPISGEVVAVNETLEDEPEQVNTHPFAEGWLVRIKPSDESEIDALMDADTYKESCDE